MARVTAVGGLLFVITAAVAQAQTPGSQPAEFPPASYTAPQYVDSTGCVFVRTGVGGTTAWVPRLDRSRAPLCGFQPSLQSATVAPSLATSAGQESAERGAVSSQTRIVPKHVAEKRANARSVVIPRGYRLVWEDDRLNPRRAEQTYEGQAQMRQIWTDTLPRRLVNSASDRK